MTRKPGPDQIKLELILYALRASPHGSWVRDIAKRTGLSKSTVAHYLNCYLKDKVDVVHDSKHIKIVKLKDSVKGKHKAKPAEEPEEIIEPQAEEETGDIPDYIG